MELFILGLLAGIALGMWAAILLYRWSGKAQPGWPFRRTRQDGAPPEGDVSPGGEEDEIRYAEQELARLQRGASTRPAQAEEASRAHGSVVYTEPHTGSRSGDPDSPFSRTRDEMDAEFDAATADWPDDWEDDEWEDDEWDEEESDEDESDEGGRAERGAPAMPSEDPRIDDYTRLLQLLDGDEEAAEELIEAEHKRTPAVARSRLIENALLRLQHGRP